MEGVDQSLEEVDGIGDLVGSKSTRFSIFLLVM